MSQLLCILDFETFSETNLKAVGGYEYARHPSTEIICVAWRIGTRETLRTTETKSWCPFTPTDSIGELLAALANPKITLIARNAYFEQVITRYVLGRDFYTHKELISIPPSRWICTASLAAALALPRSLEGTANALKLPVKKDMDGRRLILKWCKPRKPTKNNPNDRHNDPDELRRIIQYCKTDVEVDTEAFLRCPPLTPTERRVWVLDQEINLLGIAVDRSLVTTVLGLIGEEVGRLNAEVSELTFGALDSATKRDRVLAWLEDEGLYLPDLTKKTVEDTLAGGLATGAAKRMLEIRQATAKTSTAKYQAFDDRSKTDGRLRDILVYHAATTGRWGGSGAQLQNLPRGTIKDSVAAAEILAEGDLEWVRTLYGDPMRVFSSCLRNVLVAPPGKVLDVADYNAVELRVAFWVAKHEEGLKTLREGRDLYRELASKIYRKPIAEINGAQRFVGKTAQLGCFGEKTLVLTYRGWVPIVKVKQSDLLWDGVDWVRSRGVAYQGVKETIKCKGITVTPDHQVLTLRGWVTVESLGLAENTSSLRSAISTGSLGLKVLRLDRVAARGLSLCRALVTEATYIRLIPIIFRNGLRLGAKSVKDFITVKTKNIGGVTLTSCPMTPTGSDYLTGYPLAFSDAITRKTKGLLTTVSAGYAFTNRGVKTGNYFLSILSRCRAGMTPYSNSIGKMLIKVMPRVIYDSLHGLITRKTKDESQTSKTKSPVYDIVSSGPRQRFTVLTAAGPLIVHNCVYGMGKEKFAATCLDQGQDLPRELSDLAVDTFREVNAPIVKLWAMLELAARSAIENPGRRYTINRTTWSVKDGFLWCQLPSGRKLAYADPSVQWDTVYGRKRPVVYYWATDGMTKQWTRQKTWGGTLTENVVQAIARDLMAEAMLRIESYPDWEIVLSVHDELIAERKLGTSLGLKEFCDLMSELPDWATGCPVTASGWSGNRYRK